MKINPYPGPEEYDKFVMATILCHDIDYLYAGLVEEVGELMRLRRKRIKSGQAIMGSDNVKDELGDILWYVTALINTEGLSDLDEIKRRNIKKLCDKFGGVPDEFNTSSD